MAAVHKLPNPTRKVLKVTGTEESNSIDNASGQSLQQGSILMLLLVFGSESCVYKERQSVVWQCGISSQSITKSRLGDD